MKEKIIIFVIGLLIGGIIASGAFLVYTNVTNTSNCNVQNIGMNGGTPPEMPNRENGTPPEKPDGNNNEPPAKPNDNNTQNSN